MESTIPTIPPAAAAQPPVTAPRIGPGASAAKAARDFEAVFLSQYLQMMMNTGDTDAPFGGGHGEEMFRGVLAEKLGTAIADRGGIGLAPVVLNEIIRLQGESR